MAHKIDQHVGAAIRERRVALGMRQADLAGRLGISYQQLQKYELGSNRVSAGRLYEIAGALGVEPAWFFENADQPRAVIEHGGHRRTFLEISKHLERLTPERRAVVLQFVKALADEPAVDKAAA